MAIGGNYYNLLKEIIEITRFYEDGIAGKVMDTVKSFETENKMISTSFPIVSL